MICCIEGSRYIKQAENGDFLFTRSVGDMVRSNNNYGIIIIPPMKLRLREEKHNERVKYIKICIYIIMYV